MTIGVAPMPVGDYDLIATRLVSRLLRPLPNAVTLVQGIQIYAKT